MASQTKIQKLPTKTSATPPLPAPAPPPLSLTNNRYGALGPGPKVDWKLISKKQRPSLLPKPVGVQENPEPNLAKPFTSKSRRLLASNTRRLIERRNLVHQELLRAVEREKTGLDDYTPRPKLLLQQDRLQKQELRHLKKHIDALAERKRLYRCDPTEERAKDLYLIRTLLSRFKKNLLPFMGRTKTRERKSRNESGPRNSSPAERVGSKSSKALLEISDTLSGGADDSSVANKKIGATDATKKSDGKRKRLNDDDSTYKITKAIKAQKNDTPSSGTNSDREEEKVQFGKKDKKSKRQDSALDKGAKVELANSEEKLKKPKEKKHKSDGDRCEDEETTEVASKKSKKDKSKNLAHVISDAIDDIAVFDKAPVKPKSPETEKKAKATKPEDTGTQKPALKGHKVPTIKISEPAAGKSKEVLTTKAAQQSHSDPNQHYFSRRRAEMLNDPLGFDDCVMDIPPHRRKKNHKHSHPALMSGAIDTRLATKEKSSVSPHSKANQSESPQHKVKSGKKVKVRSKSDEFMMTPALPVPIQKDSAHRHDNHSSHSKHSGSRHDSNDLRAKFNKNRKSPKSKSDRMGTVASETQTGAGKFHATTNSPKSTDISISQQAIGKEDVHSDKKGNGAAEMKSLSKEDRKDTRVGGNAPASRPAGDHHVDTLSPTQTKSSAYLPSKIVNHATIHDHLNRGANLKSPVPLRPPKPHDVYSMRAGSGVHIKDLLENLPRRKKNRHDRKLSPDQRSSKAMPSPDRSWWKQDRTTSPTPMAHRNVLYSSKAAESQSPPSLPSLRPPGGNSPQDMDLSPVKKDSPSKFDIEHVNTRHQISTSPIPLPPYVPQGTGNGTGLALKKITPIPLPMIPSFANKASNVPREPEKKVTLVPLPALDSSMKKKTLCLRPPTHQLDGTPDMPSSPTLMVGAKRRAVDDLVSVLQPTDGDQALRALRKRARKSTGSLNLSIDQAMALDEKRRSDRKVLAEERRRWKAMMGLGSS